VQQELVEFPWQIVPAQSDVIESVIIQLEEAGIMTGSKSMAPMPYPQSLDERSQA